MKKILLGLLLSLNLAAFSQSVQIQNQATAPTNITAQNLNPLTGVATAGSFVALKLYNQTALGVSVSGTYTGALSLQYSTDGGFNWITVSNANALTLYTTAVATATITSAAVGNWSASVTGITDVRISALAAMTGTAVVTLTSSSFR